MSYQLRERAGTARTVVSSCGGVGGHLANVSMKCGSQRGRFMRTTGPECNFANLSRLLDWILVSMRECSYYLCLFAVVLTLKMKKIGINEQPNRFFSRCEILLDCYGIT